MSTLSSIALPKPKDWQDFERKMGELAKRYLNDPETKLHGRSGQPQAGVDVYGYRNRDPSNLVGVQCKKRQDDAVTAEEVRAELSKALAFSPPIAEFILVTTAPRDVRAQEAARELTHERANTDRPIIVNVWGWDDIEAIAAQHSDAWKAFDPTFNPYAEQAQTEILAKLHVLQQAVETLGLQTPKAIGTDVDTGPVDSPHSVLHGSINAYEKVLDSGRVTDAIDFLESLRAEHWDKASPSERRRLSLVLAKALLKINRQESAAEHILAAVAAMPEHATARLNEAKGRLLSGQLKQAELIAKGLLTDDAQNAEAAGLLLQCHRDDEPRPDLLAEIPPHLHETADVLLAQIHVLRYWNDQAWITCSDRAKKLFPDNDYFAQCHAEAVLESVVGDEPTGLAGAVKSEAAQAGLDEAVTVLHTLATKSLKTSRWVEASLAHNAAVALRLTNRVDEARVLLDETLKIHRDNPDIVLQRAAIALGDDDYEQVLALIPVAPADDQLKCMRAQALIAKGDLENARALLATATPAVALPNLRLGLIAARASERLKARDAAAAEAIARAAVEQTPDDLGIRSIEIQVLEKVGQTDAATERLVEAVQRVDSKTRFLYRVLLAVEADRLRRFDLVVSLLDGHISLDRNTDALQLLLGALINGRHQRRAAILLESLTQVVASEPDILRIRAIFALNSGSPEAEGLVTASLVARPWDLAMVVARCHLLRRRGADNELATFLREGRSDDLRGSPKDKMTFCVFVVRWLSYDEGMQLAYRTLLENWSNPDVHVAYQALCLFSKHTGGTIPESSSVANEYVVTLTGENGEKRRYRIESERPSIFAADYLTPEEELTGLLLGRSIGDVFKLQEGLGAISWKVESIKHVWLDALHKSLDEFNQRFPSATSLRKFTFREDADDPFHDIREVTKARVEADERALTLYETDNLPLCFVAALIGKNPLELWEALLLRGHKIKVCAGIKPERQKAQRTLAERTRAGVVVDAITIAAMRRFGISEEISKICGPIYTTQSVLDLFLYRIEEARNLLGTESGFLTYQEGRLVFQKYTAEQLRAVFDARTADLEWARHNCKIVPVVPKDDLAADVRETINLLDSAVSDPAIAAQGEGLVLLSDDFGYRSWAEECLGVSGAWLQAALFYGRENSIIDPTTFCKATVQLALRNHWFTSLDASVLTYQTAVATGGLSQDLQNLIATLGEPEVDLSSNFLVAGAYLDALAEGARYSLDRLKLASEVFAALSRQHPAEQSGIVAALVKGLSSDARQIFSEHAIAWLIGHSLGLAELERLMEIQREGERRKRTNSPRTLR